MPEIPPPPPRPITKRAKNTRTPSTIAAQRVRTVSKYQDVLHEYNYDPEIPHQMPGAPRHVTSNMPAVSSAIGMMSADQARSKIMGDRKKMQWNGRTSKAPELGPTARKADRPRAAFDR